MSPAVDQIFQLAMERHQAGRLVEADALYRQTLALHPHHADALHLLGVIAHQSGRHDLAVATIRQAIALDPSNPGAFSNLGEAYRSSGHFAEAVAAYRDALRLEADYPEAHNNLGIALSQLERSEEAIAEYRQAIQLRPAYPDAHNNLGVALHKQSHYPEAAEAFRAAIRLRPGYANAYYNLATALTEQGQYPEAATAFQKTLELDPAKVEARFNYSLLLLLLGDFEQGWPLYESRWCRDPRGERTFPQPRWDGGNIEGQRVLLHAEQGFGDALQFVRYAPMVAGRGARVIIECQPELKALLESVEGVSQTFAREDPLPAFDLHCPMMSLPLVFGTTIDDIPCPVPYLTADPAKVAGWQERLQSVPVRSSETATGCPVWKAGLVWAGGTRPDQPQANQIDRLRSLSLSQLTPLANVPGVVFISLQKGTPAAQAGTPPTGLTLLDWTNELHDFADTAALVKTLDLVITVDTAVAHLAGALGKPVWLLNRFGTCWRWGLTGETTPWYPTMRLFRQPARGDWDSVITRVAEELRKLAGTHSANMS